MLSNEHHQTATDLVVPTARKSRNVGAADTLDLTLPKINRHMKMKDATLCPMT